MDIKGNHAFIFTLTTLVLTFGCTQNVFDKVERELVVRDHSMPDSISSDVLYFNEKILHTSMVDGNAPYSYEWDSLLSASDRDVDSEIIVSDSVYLTIISSHRVRLNNNSVFLSEYLAIFKTSIGELDNYGIFVENLGTIYYRGYHSRKILEMNSASSSDVEWINDMNVEMINSFVRDSIINNAPLFDSSGEEEIQNKIDLNINGLDSVRQNQ